MKYLMSIGRILSIINIREILDEIKTNGRKEYIDGIELSTTDYDIMEYCLKYMMENNKAFSLHSPKNLSVDDLKEYLSNVDKLSKIAKQKINVVFHSIEEDNIDKSVQETIKYIGNVLEHIKTNKYEIKISLENLNYHNGVKRINMNSIDKVLVKYDDIYFTYDIGHDIYDNNYHSELTNLQKQKLNNIHIHNIKNSQDHHPIYTKCEIIDELRKSVKYLKEIGYNGNLVIEEGIDYFPGADLRKKLETYMDSFKDKKETLE